MRTVIHAGMHKTGSTSIQATLHKNHTALKRQGILYPTESTIWYGHHRIPWALGVNHPSRSADFDLNATVDHYIEETEGNTLVLSSEDFELLRADQIAPLLTKLAAHGPVQIVYYFRHPADWVESGFKWHAHKEPNRFRDIEHYIEEGRVAQWVNYFEKASRLAKLPAELVPRLYSREVTEDFIRFIGADGIEAHRQNESIRSLTAKIAGTLARDSQISPAFVSQLDDSVKALTDKDSRVLSEAQFHLFMEMVSPNIERFVKRFLPEGIALLDRTWKAPALSHDEEQEIIRKLMVQRLAAISS